VGALDQLHSEVKKANETKKKTPITNPPLEWNRIPKITNTKNKRHAAGIEGKTFVKCDLKVKTAKRRSDRSEAMRVGENRTDQNVVVDVARPIQQRNSSRLLRGHYFSTHFFLPLSAFASISSFLWWVWWVWWVKDCLESIIGE